jgi:hypothetical protein
MHTRIALNYLSEEMFREKFVTYSKNLIIKGVPPMLVDLKQLYKDDSKVKIIEE